MTTDWIEYTGSDEQIAEMQAAKNGYLLRFSDGREVHLARHYKDDLLEILNGVTHYLICNPHPLVDMIIKQAQTGQPVWIRMPKKHYFDKVYKGKLGDRASLNSQWWIVETTLPDWNIPNAEYSFKEFE